MILKRLIVLCFGVVAAAPAFAAVEFLRLEGQVEYEYPSLPGLEVGQFLYFDFQIDTEAVLGSGQFHTIFEAGWHGGNYPVAAESATANAPANDHVYREIKLVGDLFIGEEIYCGDGIPRPGCGADSLDFDWEVGSVAGFYLDFYENPPIAELTVTYRDGEPPPPIPVPAAIWFLASAMSVLVGLKRFRRHG